METAQKFSLGTLFIGKESQAPNQVKLSIRGRGVFCSVRLDLSFATDDPSVPRVLIVDRPWNAILTRLSLNSELVDEGSLGGEERIELPGHLNDAVGRELSDGSPEALCCHFEVGQSLRTVTLEFALACDVLWHQSEILFRSFAGATRLSVQANWDLSGLPGAHLECSGVGSESRFSSLEGSRQNWTEELVVGAGEELGLTLALDEKKAASLCLYSEFGSPGCGAVMVVAPVRPQLVRKPVKIAVIAEVRNPQDGLIVRDLIDNLSSSLNSDDLLSIFLMGSTFTRSLLEWTEAAHLQEETLAQLLEPEHMGRAQYFWESFQQVAESCRDASHLVVATPGADDAMPDDFNLAQPVFAFATGRRPNTSGMEAMAIRSNGFLSENSIEGIDSFLKRIEIRLSPPLLRDFRLEGWGLEDIHPPGLTQVYTDKPTVVLGQYDGLLPQTVTLGGYSPAGQKLAQRVRVETFSDFDLMPLYQRKVQPFEEKNKSLRKLWKSQGFTLAEVVRPFPNAELFSQQESPADADAASDGPPSMEAVPPAVAFDDEMELFAGPAGGSVSDDIFADSPPHDEEIFSPPGQADFFSASVDDGPTFLDDIPTSGKTLDFEGSIDMINPDDLDFGSEDADAPRLSLTKHGPTEDEVIDSEDNFELHFGDAEESRDAEFSSSEVFESGSQESVPSEEPLVAATLERDPEKATLMVETGVPGWVKQLTDLETDVIGDCLSSCPIDPLALALAETDDALADTFLQRLEPKRMTAVKLQMEMAKLLPSEEREQAGSALEMHIKEYAR